MLSRIGPYAAVFHQVAAITADASLLSAGSLKVSWRQVSFTHHDFSQRLTALDEGGDRFQ